MRSHVGQTAMQLLAHVNFEAHFLDFCTKYDRVVFSPDGSNENILPPRHQNWRIFTEFRNRDIYLRYNTQIYVVGRIELDKGVHVSISSISDPRVSSSASESTLFYASSSAPSSAEACLLRIVLSCKDLVQVALHCTALWSCTLHVSLDF